MKVIVPRVKPLYGKAALFSVGLDTYWKQFPGLLDEMEKKTAVLAEKLRKNQLEVIDFGMVDNPRKAYEVLPEIKKCDPDIVIVDMVTYATSSTFGCMIRELDCPVILAALQPSDALDYPVSTTFLQLCNDDLCAVPEFAGVALRMGKEVADIIIGKLYNDERADEELAAWCRIAHVRHDLTRSRIGLMGHVLESMLDMHTDPTAVTAAFGCHVNTCEPEEIMEEYRETKEDSPEVTEMKKRILAFFDTPDPVSDPLTIKLTQEDLLLSARIAVALEKFIARKALDGFAYYWEGEENSEMRKLVTNFIVGNSLLTGAGFPMCGEFDIKTCIAMFIMDRLEAGGSFAEFHPIDFARNTVLVGHDGPHHINIADRKPVIRSLKKYHGKPGQGAGVEFNIQRGPITLLSIGVNKNGKFKFIIAEGESLPGPIPPPGNTNTHGMFGPDIREFLRKWCLAGPTHHFALGVGHCGEILVKIAKSFGVDHEFIR